MRFIYMDEAGIAENEPITVVVGIVVHADSQYLETEKCLKAVLDTVPKQYRDGFISHATSIWSDPKFRDGWSKIERGNFLRNLVAIPRTLELPIIFSVVRRSFDAEVPNSMTRADFHHMLAFGSCVQRADDYIQKNCGPDEIATVVAEDSPYNRRTLQEYIQKCRNEPMTIELRRRIMPKAQAADTPRFVTFQIRRIKDAVHFVKKSDSPILQIADVCAWGLRRFLQALEFGDEMEKAMNGPGGPVIPRDAIRDIGSGMYVANPSKF